jgi:hypothetical protein
MLAFIPPLLRFLHDLLMALATPDESWPDRSAYLLLHDPH